MPSIPRSTRISRLIITQQLLAGFGVSTNERYMQIAKKNLQITDLAFRAQVIATVTQVENIYWDLVNAYQDEQIKERLLDFCPARPFPTTRSNLSCNAIPAMQVTKDESDVATSEGDLTVARATLRLNELLIKNAITKTDDPTIDEMPVIPLDTKGPADPNATKSIDDLIAEAEKNRPDVTQDELAMQVAEESLKSIRSELLPTLNVYGLYAGAGTAGPKNPNCSLGPAECASELSHGLRQHVPEHLQLLLAGVSVRNESVDQPAQPCRQGRSISRRAGIPAETDHLRGAEEEHPFRRAQLAVRAAAGAGPRGAPRRKPATWRNIPSMSRNRNRNSEPSPAPIRWPRSTIWASPNRALVPHRRSSKKRKWISTAPPGELWNRRESRSTMRKRA